MDAFQVTHSCGHIAWYKSLAKGNQKAVQTLQQIGHTFECTICSPLSIKRFNVQIVQAKTPPTHNQTPFYLLHSCGHLVHYLGTATQLPPTLPKDCLYCGNWTITGLQALDVFIPELMAPLTTPPETFFIRHFCGHLVEYANLGGDPQGAKELLTTGHTWKCPACGNWQPTSEANVQVRSCTR